MHGGAIYFSDALNNQADFDLILCTDMLDVATFKGLLKYRVPIVTYFHENQLVYPVSDFSKELNGSRDMHYAWLNYTTCLASDALWFNSEFNKVSWFDALGTYLKQFPDYNPQLTERLVEKASVKYVGVENPGMKKSGGTGPIRILWNHRWEHDKGPEEFHQVLKELKKLGVPFSLILLGERQKRNKYPALIEAEFSDETVFTGYAESREKYLELLHISDVLPVTSRHEFFGISVMEAAMAGVQILVPDRLSYPELYGEYNYVYASQKNLIERIAAINHDQLPIKSEQFRKFEWHHLINEYDDGLRSVKGEFDLLA
jgi:glycosyltransferase involved in cell wall biosynthesis